MVKNKALPDSARKKKKKKKKIEGESSKENCFQTKKNNNIANTY